MEELSPPSRTTPPPRPTPPAPPPLPPRGVTAVADAEAAARRLPAALASLERLRLAPDADDRMVRGIAGGIAREAGLRSASVRAGFVVLAFAGGVGVLAYLAMWVLVVDDDAPARVREPATRVQRLGGVVGLVGALLVCRSLGLWLGDAVVWLVSTLAVTSWAVWSLRPEPAELPGWRPSWPRLVLGGGLAVAALALVLVGEVDVAQLRASVLALGLGAAAVVLLAGPWLGEVAGVARRERHQRLHEQARGEVAAHLHDSVLQTLALIQRSHERPARVVALARRQERELRAWLYGGADAGQPTSLAAVVDALAAEVEDRHEVDVDAVGVGLGGWRLADPAGPAGALLDAAREALANAALHAGVRAVDLFVELDDGALDVWVRDRGKGFDPAAVPAGRHGLRDSVHGRAERAGGRARVRSAIGEGTEVHLHHPGPPPALGLARTDVPAAPPGSTRPTSAGGSP